MDLHIIKITICGRRFFLLWNGELEPPLLVDDDSGLPIFFSGLFDLNNFAEENDLEIERGVTAYDLDDITVTAENLVCKEVIDKWNFFSDLALTVGEEFSGEDKRFNDIYDKLFFGCNLPAMNHPHYDPEWNDEEIAEMNGIFAEGAELCKRFFIDDFCDEN